MSALTERSLVSSSASLACTPLTQLCPLGCFCPGEPAGHLPSALPALCTPLHPKPELCLGPGARPLAQSAGAPEETRVGRPRRCVQWGGCPAWERWGGAQGRVSSAVRAGVAGGCEEETGSGPRTGPARKVCTGLGRASRGTSAPERLPAAGPVPIPGVAPPFSQV